MKSPDSLSLKIIGWSMALGAAISMFATPALSEPFVACLQSEGTECRLIAPTVGITIGVADGDALISYYVPDVKGLKVDHVDSVGRDMEAQVLSGQMTDDDAAYVFAELLSSHDLQYRVPVDASMLKRFVGLPEAAPLSPQDQVDVIASHVQMNLGVSAVTADYLVVKLGLQIIEPVTSDLNPVVIEADADAVIR